MNLLDLTTDAGRATYWENKALSFMKRAETAEAALEKLNKKYQELQRLK